MNSELLLILFYLLIFLLTGVLIFYFILKKGKLNKLESMLKWLNSFDDEGLMALYDRDKKSKKSKTLKNSNKNSRDN